MKHNKAQKPWIMLFWKDKLLNHCVKEGCKNEVRLSQDQLPNRALPATKWNMASPPVHRRQDRLGQQTTSATLKHEHSSVWEIIINKGELAQLLAQMLAINTTRFSAFCTMENQECRESIIYAEQEKVVRSNNAYRQSRSARRVYRAISEKDATD